MLRLIEGGHFAGGHEIIKDEIKLLTSSGKGAFLIVPEQQTVSVEREMADYLPTSAPLFFEVTNFTRFANTVFRSLGGLSKESINGTKKALFMWKALNELAPSLTVIGKGEINAGVVAKMQSAVGQMQSAALTPKELFDTKKKLSDAGGADERLMAKLNDISEIMALYKKLISDRYSEADDALFDADKRLLRSGAEFLSGKKIYIDGFTSFTEPQYKLISTLIKLCEVTVNLNLPKSNPDAFEYTEVKKAHTKLLHIANIAGVDVSQKRIDGRGGAVPVISELSTLLWRSGAKADSDALAHADAIRIFEASDPHEECDFVANDIKRRVIEGARYSDFGIIMRSAESYLGIIDVSFDKAGIPLFISTRTDIGSFEAVKLIFSAFAAVCGDYSRRDVISYAKCSLSGVSRALVDEFELYVEKWQINGKRFTDGIFWNMNPDGYSEHRKSGSGEKLLRIDEARNKIIQPLTDFDTALRECKTVKDYATATVEFLTRLGIEDALKQKSEGGGALTKMDGGNVLSRLWRIICDALDSLNDALGELSVKTDTFVNLLKIAFSAQDIGKIPAFAEQVQAASADMARMRGKKHIYIIGSNAGVFPPAIDDDSFFSDSEKSVLSEIGLTLEADTEVRSARELYYYTRSIAFAEKSVTVLYPAEDSSFKAQAPSDAVVRMLALLAGTVKVKKIKDMPVSEKIYSAECAPEIQGAVVEGGELDEALREAGLECCLAVSRRPIRNSSLKLGANTLSALYGDEVKMSQSKLEKYIGCPMSYFCSYNLGISAEERVEFDNRNIGIFVHSILECFFAELKKRGKGISDITNEEKDELIRRVSSDYINGAFSGMDKTPVRLSNTIDNLCRAARPIIDSLADEFADCSYEPTFFELDISRKRYDSPEPAVFVTDKGAEIYFEGKIDRVDTFSSGEDVYVRVIDYKTGSKKFSPEDIARGENLQMFLYLKSVTESKNPEFLKRIGLEKGALIPAGVIYVKANVTAEKISRNDPEAAMHAAKRSQEREGMILDDPTSLEAMNSGFIPVKFTKSGAPDAKSRSKLYSHNGWDEITKTMEMVIGEECSRMLDGDISASPLIKKGGKASVCKYCDYKPFCRNSNFSKKEEY